MRIHVYKIIHQIAILVLNFQRLPKNNQKIAKTFPLSPLQAARNILQKEKSPDFSRLLAVFSLQECYALNVKLLVFFTLLKSMAKTLYLPRFEDHLSFRPIAFNQAILRFHCLELYFSLFLRLPFSPFATLLRCCFSICTA